MPTLLALPSELLQEIFSYDLPRMSTYNQFRLWVRDQRPCKRLRDEAITSFFSHHTMHAHLLAFGDDEQGSNIPQVLLSPNVDGIGYNSTKFMASVRHIFIHVKIRTAGQLPRVASGIQELLERTSSPRDFELQVEAVGAQDDTLIDLTNAAILAA